MILLAEATRAKEIASILDIFRDHDLDNRRAIDATVANLEDLSNVLRDLVDQIDARDGHLPKKFLDDLDLLQHSVAYTLGDLWVILGSMPEECIAIDYRNTWKDIVAYTESTRRESLHKRIERYTIFAAALRRALRSEPQRRGAHIDDLREDINSLRLAQLNTRRFITATEAINDLSTMQQALPRLAPAPASSAMIKQPRSTERVRPPHLRPKSPESVESGESHPFVPSPPLSPQSPTATFSSIASQASSAEVETKHWAGHIFKDLPSTRIVDEKNHEQWCACYPLSHDSSRWPTEDEYDRILKINFPRGFKMHYYLRRRDYRTKIVCEWPRNRSRMQAACLPLGDLHVKRDGSILYLCRAVAGYSNNTVWAQIKCLTFEWLVIFHLTFLALRSQDRRQTFLGPFDRELKGETREFAGAITDSDYHHALRLYKDRHTGVLRLEAAVLDGPMKDTPIWTAFITHQITSPTWLERSNRGKRVYLADLKRHIFSSEYTPHIASSGQHILAFDSSEDAEDFESNIRVLARRRWEDSRR